MTTATIAVSRQCEYKKCNGSPTNAYVITGDVGEDGIAVYCERHSEEWADGRDSHTAVTTVDGDGK